MTLKPAPAPPSGRIGRYEVGASIAAGGMATVYLARMSGPQGFEKLVALKRVHPHLAQEPAFVEMFLDEANIASRIQHPNVCQVFDFGSENDDYFIAMEFLVGETLSKVQRAVAHSELLHHARRPYVLTRLIVDACEGLHAAHELRGRDGELMNVVHRDISPQNVFITFDGNAKIVDFGIASASDRLHQTSSGTVKGKFAYMAPEQANGKGVDRRSDVWALGVVLWELLAFRRLFRRDTPGQSLAALLHDEIIPPSQVSPLAPPELDAIVLRALERDPDKRYPTARELGRDLLRTTGRLGDPVDRAEVEEWMETLFPDGKRRHEMMLETARWGAAEATELSEPSVSDVISRSSWSGIKGDVVDEAEVELLLDDSLTQASEPPPPLAAPRDPAPPRLAAPSAGEAPSLTPTAVPKVAPSGSPWPRRIGLGALFLLLSFLTGFGLFMLVGPEEIGGEPPSQVAAAEPAAPAGDDGSTPSDPAAGAQAGEGEAGEGEAEAEETDEGEAEETAAGDTDEGETGEAEEVSAGSDRSAPSRRRRRRRDPGATSSGTGTVIVSTPGGWANVYDQRGRFLGETPLTVSLPGGSHRLSLRPYGQPPSRSVTVNVTPGQTSRVNRPL